jgi:protein-disulfide isomerase
MKRAGRQASGARLTTLAIVVCALGAAQTSPNEVLALVNGEAITAWSRGRQRFPGVLASEAKYRIRRALEDQKGAEALQALIRDLRRQATIINYLNEKAAAELVAEGAPALGPNRAPVEVVEFADFECPFCRKAQPVVLRALSRWEGKLRLVFRHFPLPQRPHAFQAAVAAVCAERQGRLFEYRRALFEHTGPLNEETLTSLAELQGLPAAEFAGCLKDPTAAERVRRDIELGRRTGVSGTPTFFVNGRRVADVAQLEAAIEEAFEHARANQP